jgi:plastocyanin
MSRIHLVLATAVIAALAFAASASAAPIRLSAVVGPAFNITVKKGALKVRRLKPGRYLIVVADRSNIHNFHLRGPGINRKTGVAAKGTFRWRVTLKRGLYRYVCDPHAPVMKGSFRVG